MHDTEQQLRVPVAFMVFNRPEPTARVFAEIARARPKLLLVIADGPRADRPADVEACRKVREIIERVDWNCEVRTNFAPQNLGCKQRVASGLDWVFAQVESAIILEDDCLPDPSFFPFCAELLDRYREDPRVASISGNNFCYSKLRDDSYLFTKFGSIWGWATWRRAWKKYDVAINDWPVMRDSGHLETLLENRADAKIWTDIFAAVYEGKIDTWDYQWVFSVWRSQALSIVPRVNLISNIGFGAEATHTKVAVKNWSALPTTPMDFPLRHPQNIGSDRDFDGFARTLYQPPSFFEKVMGRAKRLFS